MTSLINWIWLWKLMIWYRAIGSIVQGPGLGKWSTKLSRRGGDR